MQRTIAATMLLVTLSLGGLSACSQPNASEYNASEPNTSEPAQADKGQSSERTQRREAMRQQIEAVLTPEQRQQLQAKLQQGSRLREAMAGLNITPEQKTKIQEIMKTARSQRPTPAPSN